MDKVAKIIAEVFKINAESIKPEMTPDDIELWDSLGQLFLINRLEGEFEVTFEIQEIFEIMSIRDIYSILERKKVLS